MSDDPAITVIGPEAEAHLDWIALTDALAAGHRLPRAELRDSFLYRGRDTLLSRAAWIDGLGLCVKSATIFPGNAETGRPVVGGGASLFSDRDGRLEAVLDFALVTKWKTAGDSLLAARHLAPPEVREVLIVGAGAVGRALREAYGALFPGAAFAVWNRGAEGAERFAAACPGTRIAPDLEAGVRGADVIACATMATDPVIRGDWLRPGQHLDLIGAYRPDMREADDEVMRRGRIFVDNRETVLPHIGELAIPIAAGVIGPDAVVADFYEIDRFGRAPDDITVFKNGGGAHLDLMTCRYILDALECPDSDRGSTH